jgi:glyoxylate carboligase
MSKTVADVLWEMLAKAGVKRCYGIVGDALNPVVDALRRNGAIEFVPVRHEEYGVFAAVAEAYFTGNPVVVCGTAGPGVVHLPVSGLRDISTVEETADSLAHSRGRRWPTLHRTRSDVLSHIQADSA